MFVSSALPSVVLAWGNQISVWAVRRIVISPTSTTVSRGALKGSFILPVSYAKVHVDLVRDKSPIVPPVLMDTTFLVEQI